MAVGGNQKLDGAGVGVANFTPQLPGQPAKLPAHFRRQLGRRRRFLNQLLVATLDGAVPLVKMQHIAVLVGNQLHLNMGCALQVALVEQAGIGKSGLGGFASALNNRFQLRHSMHYVDADAAAAGGSFDHHGEAQLPRFGDRLCVRHRLFGAGHHGQARLAGDPAGGELVGHLVQHFLNRADERHAGGLATLGECAVFGEETVTGVDCLGPGGAAGVDHGVNVQV